MHAKQAADASRTPRFVGALWALLSDRWGRSKVMHGENTSRAGFPTAGAWQPGPRGRTGGTAARRVIERF